MAFGILGDLVGDGHGQHAGEDPADFAVAGADQIPVVELGRGGGKRAAVAG